jgi:hypothetical protein
LSGLIRVTRVRHGRDVALPRPLAPLTGLLLALVFVLASAPPALAEPPALEAAAPDYSTPGQTWTFNMFHSSVVRYQNPDWTACTAAAALSMLNLIALEYDEVEALPRHGVLPQTPFKWQIDTSYPMQQRILRYERANMTMGSGYPGSDPHGWRNALNYFGWGSIDAGVYRDTGYPSFDAAARATVTAIARHGRPVGILGWFGGHAQYVTGYTVQGEDPRVGSHWSIVGVYITDPWQADQMRNEFLTYKTWKSGPLYQRFSPYYQNESWIKDPLEGTIGYREWWRRFVIIEPTS